MRALVTSTCVFMFNIRRIVRAIGHDAWERLCLGTPKTLSRQQVVSGFFTQIVRLVAVASREPSRASGYDGIREEGRGMRGEARREEAPQALLCVPRDQEDARRMVCAKSLMSARAPLCTP